MNGVGDQYLQDFAKKCSCSSEKTIRKAKELLSLLESKKTIACSESCKVAACLELANNVTGGSISREMLIKYSGCKKSSYINMFNIISKVLNLDKIYSVKEICLTLGVSEIQTYASSLLETYKKANNLSKDQTDHPMYACAATIAACRVNKIRVNSASVVEFSRIKKTELETLIHKIELLGKEQAKGKAKKRGFDGKVLFPSTASAKADVEKKIKTEKEIDEEFLQWKQRMLAE